MKVILTGGGTGGHIYPALAIAKEIKERHPNAEILYVGSATGLEADIVPKAGIPFEPIVVSGFKRSLSFENVKTIYRFIKATRRSRSLIRSFQADVVIGTGGYVSGPVVHAAAKLGIPTIIHEQNVIPGLANKFLAKRVSRVAVSFSGSARYFPKNKVVVTGNPRATEAAKADPKIGRSSLSLRDGKRLALVVGGSRGAKAINDAFIEAIPRLVERNDTHYVYVTGEVHYRQAKERLARSGPLPENIAVYPFIYNMPEVLAATDLIVNRAGASFLAEITSLGIPSILIPSPYVTNNHQEKNARWLEERGAAVVLLEQQLTGDLLAAEMNRLLDDPEKLESMKRSAKELGEPRAAEKLYDEIRKLTRR